jgi:uncharacterized damage-inducible protein DinB
MRTAYVAGALLRELRALRRELEAYPDERDLWRPVPGASNTAGTLALHLAGGLRHFIGATLGGDGYVRDRAAEFVARDVPRRELIERIEAAAAAVERTLAALPEGRLDEPYPERVAGVTLTTGDFLVHLVAHLAYHLGQVDYHRRVVTGQPGTIGVVSVGELATARKAP